MWSKGDIRETRKKSGGSEDGEKCIILRDTSKAKKLGKTQKQPKCPSTDEWIKKYIYIYIFYIYICINVYIYKIQP